MRVTLYWKLLVGFGIIIALLSAADAYVLYQLIGVSLTTRAAVTQDVRSSELSKQLRTVLYDEERFAQKYMVSGDSTYLALFQEQQHLVTGILDTLAHFGADQRVRQLVEATERRHAWYADAVAAPVPTQAALAERQEAMMDTLDLVYRNVDVLIRQKQALLAHTVVDAEESARRSGEVALLMTLGGILIAVAIALILTQSVTKPLAILVRATEEVARGTFTRIKQPIHGELGRLAAAFNDMGDRLRKANEARAEMMHHISHEIRMPLQTMHSAYYLLTEQQAGPINDRQRKLLETLRDNIDKIVRFSNQFLDLARIEAGMMEYEIGPTDLAAVLAPLIEDASVNATRKEVTLTYQPASVPAVKANPERCVQVFTNLLSNAVKYTNAGGTVKVTLAPSVFGVRVAVTDSGVGIAPEELPQLFKKFYRAKSAGRRGGTGIGLALVKALAEGMGGRVGVQSTPGQGSTFMVEFRTAG